MAGAPATPRPRSAWWRLGTSLSALGLLAAGTAHGQSAPSGRLTMENAVLRALERHPSVAASRASRDEARSGIAAAAAARLPTVGLSASATRYELPMLVTPIHGFSPDQAPPFDRTLLQGAANVGYTLFDGGTRKARVGRARAMAAAADAAVSASEQALVARVVTAYAQALSRQMILDAHDARVAALAAELARSRQRYDVGRAPQVEVLRPEAALASASAERVRYSEALRLAERELARLIGASEEETRSARLVPVRLTDSLLPPLDDLVETGRSASPAVARARRRVAAADAEVAAARGTRWPEVKLGAAYNERGSAGTRSWGEWNVGPTLSFPLFTGGAIAAEVTRARASRREAESQLDLAELQLEQEVDRARSAVEEARAREASLTSATARFAEVARIQKLALETGAGTQTDYLVAEAELLIARASLAEASMNEIAARAELARATGQLNLTWLQRVTEAKP